MPLTGFGTLPLGGKIYHLGSNANSAQPCGSTGLPRLPEGGIVETVYKHSLAPPCAMSDRLLPRCSHALVAREHCDCRDCIQRAVFLQSVCSGLSIPMMLNANSAT
jgi:hypothetical protein